MYDKSKQKSEEILKLYNEGVLLNEISKQTSSSTITVKKVLLHAGIDYNEEKKLLYQNKLEKVIVMYNQGIAQVEIEKELGLTRKTIRKLLKESNDIIYRTKSEQHHIRYGTEINHDAFDDLTDTDVLYWIGMIYSDGHIETKNEASIDLTLHNDDKEHLEKLKSFFKSNRSVKPDHGDCSRLRVNSVKIRDKLVGLGFTSNKSDKLIPHDSLKNSRDFWRGCVDGDGGIYTKTKKSLSDTITLCGTLDTIFGFIIFLNDNLDIKSKYPSPSGNNGLYQIHYYGQECIKIANLLYKDSKTSLNRKYKIYQKILKLNQ